MGNCMSNVDTALLRTSYDVGIRAAEWGTHRLGTPLELTRDVLTIAASCLVISQVLLQWVRQQQWNRPRFKRGIRHLLDEPNPDREALARHSIAGAEAAGIKSAEAEKCFAYVIDVITVDDFDSAFPAIDSS